MNAAEIWMNRCLELARLGAGKVAPNPMVGALLVHNGKVIGEGWHQAFGLAHAEVNAINNVKDKSLLKEATLYVNLEPCAHFGKTPPCANLIIEHKIPQVVIGMRDPNPLVAGKGIELLQAAGIAITEGILEHACLALNKRFLCYMQHKRPFVILKWAQTHNGFLSPDSSKMSAAQFEEERHITGFLVQKLVHKWRTQEDAIMVATNTALSDNPALNARAWEGDAPIRVVLDQHLRLPQTLKIYDQSQKTFIVNGLKEDANGNTFFLKVDFSKNWFEQLLEKLYAQQIQSLIVEGGGQLLRHIIAQNAWDEAIVFYAPKSISNGIAAPAIAGFVQQKLQLDEMQMIQYINK